MSSIMRRRNGLMACSVIGDAPVLSEVVATPQSQDRTPRCAILLAASPAAGAYRASGLVHGLITLPALLASDAAAQTAGIDRREGRRDRREDRRDARQERRDVRRGTTTTGSAPK